MKTLYLKKSVLKDSCELEIPASKSETNRCLILDALSGGNSNLANLSLSNDTFILKKALASNEKEIDVEDAGTCMRFLTAYFALTNENKILKGSARMHQRPIGILIDALVKLGAEIKYLGKKGYPPIEIKGVKPRSISSLAVAGNVSSQFISALMMVAPLLKNGLRIDLKGKVNSLPYIKLTGNLMAEFGINASFDKHSIQIPHGKYRLAQIRIDGDWTGAGYWYSLLALSKASELNLTGLSHNPLQGDAVLRDIMKNYGITSRKIPNGYKLVKRKKTSLFDFDFMNYPDIAQTLIVLSSALEMKGNFKGMESLRIKETDRIKALQNELSKMGVKLYQKSANIFSLKWIGGSPPSKLEIDTYEDHRMAMSFAPLCLKYPIRIHNPDVVKKSYPGFWNDLKSVTEPG